MAEQTARPTLAGRFGAKAQAAAAKAAKAPVRYGPESIPPGIKSGIARVTKVQLMQLKDDTKLKQLDGSSAKGQLQLQIDAAVAEPKSVAGPGGTAVRIEGRRLKSVFVPLYEKGASWWPSHVAFAPRMDLSFEDCVREATNMMRMLCGEDFPTSNFDAAVSAMDKAKPHFTFETVLKPAGGKNPTTGQPYPEQVQEFWGRGVAYKGAAASTQVTGAATAKPAAAAAPAAEPVAEEPAQFNEFGEDLRALAELADANPDAAGQEGTPEFDAAARLTEAAAAAGISEEDMTKYDNWVAIVDAMSEAGGDGTAEDAVEDDAVQEDDVVEEPKEWEKGDECEWVPPVKGPGGKEKAGTKTVRCKITGLNKSKTKANVVDVKDGKKKWENVAIDLLTRPAE